MPTLEEILEIAIGQYKDAGQQGRETLIKVFGKETFMTSWTEITTLEMAFKVAGESPNDPCFFVGSPDDIAYQLLKKVIVPAMNLGEKIDYDNEDQAKWWPVFFLNKPGFRFYCSGFDYVDTYVTGGSRLAFASKDRSDHAAKYFINIFRDFYC